MADACRPKTTDSIGFSTPLSFTVGQRLDALAWSLGDSAPAHSQSYKASAMSTSKLTRRSAEDDSIKWPTAYIIELPQKSLRCLITYKGNDNGDAEGGFASVLIDSESGTAKNRPTTHTNTAF